MPRIAYKSLDIFGTDFKFDIAPGIPKFRTKCGASFTLICIILTGSALYIFTADYLNTKSPRVTMSSETSNNFPKVELLKNGFFPVFSFMNLTKMVPGSEIQKFATIFIHQPVFGIDISEGVPQAKIIGSKFLKMVDCRQANIDSEFIKNITAQSNSELYYQLGFLLCPENIDDNKLWTIEGSGNSLPFTSFHFKVGPCSLPDPTECLPFSDFLTVEGRMGTASWTYKLDNKKNPITTVNLADRLIFGFNVGFYQVTYLKFKKIQVYDEDRDFEEAKLNKEFFSIGDTYSFNRPRDGTITCTEESMFNSQCLPYLDIALLSGPKVEVVHRIYPKLFTMISELGGFGDLIFILIGFLYFFYSNIFFGKWIEEKIIPNQDWMFLDKIASKKMQCNFSVKEIEQAKKKFILQSLNGVEALHAINMAHSFTKQMISPEYQNIVKMHPILISLSEMKEDTATPTYEESAAYVLQNPAKNEFEKILQKNFLRLLNTEEKTNELDEDKNLLKKNENANLKIPMAKKPRVTSQKFIPLGVNKKPLFDQRGRNPQVIKVQSSVKSIFKHQKKTENKKDILKGKGII